MFPTTGGGVDSLSGAAIDVGADEDGIGGGFIGDGFFANGRGGKLPLPLGDGFTEV